MGQDFYWLSHDLKRKVFIGRHFDQARYDRSEEALDKLFEFIDYDEDFDDFAELLQGKRVTDLLLSDLIKITNYLGLLIAFKKLNQQDLLVYHLEKILGAGEVVGDYDESKKYFLNEYADLVQEKLNSGGKKMFGDKE
jgi:hypothetical protein